MPSMARFETRRTIVWHTPATFMRLGGAAALTFSPGGHRGLAMRIAFRLIKWVLIAALIFTGIILLLPNFGVDIAQAFQGHMGGRWVIAGAMFIDSFLGRMVVSSYALAIGALFIIIASFLTFYRV